MDDAEINRAVAEVCGWQDIRYSDADGVWVGRAKEIDSFATPLPDYCHDLNAMAAAEQILTEASKAVYAEAIYAMLSNSIIDWGYYPGEAEIDWNAVSAFLFVTARQRAEALLRCLGRWRDA